MMIHRQTITGETITFGRAAAAAGVTDSVLRNWIDRKQVTLDALSARAGRVWLRFSAIDVLRLAIMRRLVEFGFSPPYADAVMSKHFDPDVLAIRSVIAAAPALDRPGALQVQFRARLLIVCRDSRVASISGGLPHESAWRVTADGAEPMPNPGWHPRPGSEWFIRETPTDFVVIRLGAVAAEVAARLSTVP